MLCPLLSVAVLALSGAVQNQSPVKLPAASPKASVSRTIGVTDVSIEYSSPSVRGRKIWGELVPFGEVWRTGANAATTLKLSDSLKVAGKELPAGSYSLFTIPTPEKWTVIVNSKVVGPDQYDAKNDVMRFDVKPEKAPTTAEQLSFHIRGEGMGKGTIGMHWENVKISFPVEVDVIQQVKTAVSTAAPDDFRAYHSAADYFHQSKLDAAQALAWIEKSTQIKENPWNLALKAQILHRAGKAADAAACIDKSIVVAKADKDFKKEYLPYLEKISGDIKGKS